MDAAWVWLLRSEHAGEASCATGVTCGSGVPFLPAWRHSRGPPRCDIVAVRTVTMSHRCGWRRCHRRGRSAAGGAAGACAAGGVRAEPPPGRPALAARQPRGTFPKTGLRPRAWHPRSASHVPRTTSPSHFRGNPRRTPATFARLGLWHLTPVRWGRGPRPPEESSGLRFASRFWRKSGDWAERVGDHALAQPRAAAPGALTCSGIESRRGAAWAVHPASVDVTRSAAAAQALAKLRLLWPSRSCSACCGPRGHAGAALHLSSAALDISIMLGKVSREAL